MSITRLQRVSADPKEAAKAIINYILKSFNNIDDQKQHKKELFGIMEQVGIKYEETQFNFWPLWFIEKLIHYYSRGRSEEIKSILEMMREEKQDQLTILELIAGYLEKKAGNEETSSNTNLLELLLEKLPNYEQISKDDGYKEAATNERDYHKTIRHQLRTAIVSLAQAKITEIRKLAEATSKVFKVERITAVHKLHVDDKFKQQLAGTFIRDPKDVKYTASVLKRPERGMTIMEDYTPEKSRQLKEESELRAARKAALLEKFHDVVEVIETIYRKRNDETHITEVQSQAPNKIKTGSYANAYANIEKMFAERAKVATPKAAPIAQAELNADVPMPPPLPPYMRLSQQNVTDNIPSPPAPPAWFKQTLFAAPQVVPLADDYSEEWLARINI